MQISRNISAFLKGFLNYTRINYFSEKFNYNSSVINASKFMEYFDQIEAQKQPFQIIDLRDQYEKIILKLPSKNKKGNKVDVLPMPLRQIIDKDYIEISKKKFVFLLCKGGKRAEKAQKILDEEGYNTCVIEEGIDKIESLKLI